MSQYLNNEDGRFRPDISIVIPTYNSSAYVGRTINSVIRSAAGWEHEIIMVDDCSDDIFFLRKLIEGFPSVKLIEKERKSNAAVSRNIGIEKSAGRLIFLLDSDDQFDEGYISHRIQLMQRHDYDFVFGSYVNVTPESETVVCEMPGKLNARDFLFVEDKDIRTSTISFKGSKKESFRFNERLDKHQDWAFLIDTAEKCSCWGYDSLPGVRLNCDHGSRMSGEMNVQASQLFINSYLDNPLHISGFCKRHFILAALVKNEEAYRYFSSYILLSRVKTKYKIIKIAGDFLTKLGFFNLLPRSMLFFRSLARGLQK